MKTYTFGLFFNFATICILSPSLGRRGSINVKKDLSEVIAASFKLALYAWKFLTQLRRENFCFF